MTLTTQTYDGFPGGMNQALPAQEIDDAEARYMQDIFVDQPGLARRRGPVTPVSGIAALTRKGSGLLATLNPVGSSRFAALTGDASNGFLSAYDSTLASVTDIAWPFSLPTTPASGQSYSLAVTKPALRGGTWVGTSTAYDANSPSQALGLWFGAAKANATITVTAVRGSATVTGSGFTASVDPGMFLFADTDDPYTQAYIGVVKSVDSNSSLTLVAVSPYTATGKTATFQSIRGFAPKVAKGHITTDVSAATVTGGSTKFRSQKVDAGTTLTGTMVSAAFTVTGLSSTTGLTKGMPVTGTSIGTGARIVSVDSGSQVTLSVANTGSTTNAVVFKVPWDLYRASDLTWIGTVLSVQSELGLTLMANAAISLADESYIAVRADANFSLVTTGSTQKAGFITANYADRQWYLNNGGDYATTSRAWFSDASDGEIVDMSTFDGDWVDFVSTSNVNEPVRGAEAAYNGLVVMKETETFLLTGSSPASFGVKKLEDDGAISGGSIQAYADGVIWAGREGIHFYDGLQAQNLTSAKLGDYYRNTMRTFDPTKYRMWSSVNRDHYMLFIEKIAPTVAVVKGNVSTTPTRYTLTINMITRSITIMTNLDIRGAVTIPGTATRSVWYLVNGQVAGDTADHAIICDGEALFNQEGIDTVFCDYADSAGSWTNLVPNGGFETDAANWFVNTNVSLAQSSAQAKYGTKSGLVSTLNFGTNGDFETNITGWGANNGAALSRINTDSHLGSWCLKAVTTATNFDGPVGPASTIFGQQTYTISMWVKATAGTNMIVGAFEFNNVGGAAGGGVSTNFTATGNWQFVTVTQTSPPAALWWVAPFAITTTGVIATILIDDVRVGIGFGSVVSPVGDLGAMRMGMAAGGTYTFSAWVYVPSGTGTTLANVALDFYQRVSGSYDTVTSAAPTAFDTWTKLTVTRTLSASATEAFCRVRVNDQPNNIMGWYVDGVQLETGSTAHTFIDTTTASASGSPYRDSGAVGGPDYYIESKKFDAGDGLRLKRFKQLAIWYLAQGAAMNVDVVLGLNNIGQTLTSNFPASGFTWDTLHGQIATWDALKAQFATWAAIVQSVFVPKRVRFQKKNQYMAFRLYQASSSVTRMQVSTFQLGYKPQRPGRI